MSLTFQDGDVAVVLGARGGIGSAFLAHCEERGLRTLGLSRSSDPALDLCDEESVRAAAAHVEEELGGGALRLVFDATGFLHDETFAPEKSWREIDPAHLEKAFRVNAFGPALLMKHFLPLLDRDAASVFATLSAKVGSIADNRIGGWYAYRASKAALNQFVRCAAIELHRTNKHGVCIAMHPGTVDTALSQPFSKKGLKVRPPEEAAADLFAVIETMTPEKTGRFFAYDGAELPW